MEAGVFSSDPSKLKEPTTVLSAQEIQYVGDIGDQYYVDIWKQRQQDFRRKQVELWAHKMRVFVI